MQPCRDKPFYMMLKSGAGGSFLYPAHRVDEIPSRLCTGAAFYVVVARPGQSRGGEAFPYAGIRYEN